MASVARQGRESADRVATESAFCSQRLQRRAEASSGSVGMRWLVLSVVVGLALWGPAASYADDGSAPAGGAGGAGGLSKAVVETLGAEAGAAVAAAKTEPGAVQKL